MSNLVSVQSAIKELVSFDQSKLDLIRKTVARDLNQDEFELFISIAKTRGLDPILNQIHAVVRGRGDNAKVNFQVGIDGFRLIAARTGEFAGRDETAFEYKPGTHHPERAKVTVYRFVNGHKCSWTASAKWDEYYPGETMGFMWKKLPETMLEKCAEAKALRMAFPNDLSGLYETSEMDQSNLAERQTSEPPVEIEAREIDDEGSSLNLGDYVFPLGKKFKGQRLKDVDQYQLDQYLKWFIGELEKSGKEPSSTEKEAVEVTETYLKSLEFAR